MKRSLSALTYLVLLQAAGSGLQAQTKDESPETEAPKTIILTLSFEEAIGTVGEEVSLPIQLTATQDIADPFTIILRFPPSQLEYKKLGIASQPRSAGWKLDPKLRKAPAAFDMHFLEISTQPGPGEFLPEGGLLAFAYFQIVEAVQEHAVELTASIKTTGNSNYVVKTEPATITALPEAMFACFFYMH
ncbi:MAG: hypothetical protein V3R94_01685, partial [Acidobacteriota bacterium]